MKFGPFWFVVAKGGMDKTGARKLPLAVLDKRRRRAVKLRERGLLLREVAAQVELSVPTVMAAHRADLAGGWAAVNVKTRGASRVRGQLTPEQETQIRRLI
jgi:sulfate adenylyltransferase subunit 2